MWAKRVTAKAAAARRVAKTHAREFEAAYAEECAKRGITPYETDPLPRGAGSMAWWETRGLKRAN
jgi:hypothetical protein